LENETTNCILRVNIDDETFSFFLNGGSAARFQSTLSRVRCFFFLFKKFDIRVVLILYGINKTILSAIRRSSLGFQVRFLDAKDGPLEPSNYF
jgi:hypothetical protein|tara:strand:- start:502 stop:780 length:279 start_codon:yes stop_codon:yes gene_type:complete